MQNQQPMLLAERPSIKPVMWQTPTATMNRMQKGGEFVYNGAGRRACTA